MRYAILLLALLIIPALNSCAIRSQDYYNHTQLATSDSLRDIIAVELIDGAEIHFASIGGVYSPSAHEVKGRTDAGRLVVVPLDQIASCIAKPPSGLRSMLGVVGVILGLALAVFITVLLLPKSSASGW